jgi:hypothetical protein
LVRETTITPQRPLLVAPSRRVRRCAWRAVALVRVAAAIFGRDAALALVRVVVPFVVRFAELAVVVFFFVALLAAVLVLAADPCAPSGSAGVASQRSARRGTTGSRRIKE